MAGGGSLVTTSAPCVGLPSSLGTTQSYRHLPRHRGDDNHRWHCRPFQPPSDAAQLRPRRRRPRTSIQQMAREPSPLRCPVTTEAGDQQLGRSRRLLADSNMLRKLINNAPARAAIWRKRHPPRAGCVGGLVAATGLALKNVRSGFGCPFLAPRYPGTTPGTSAIISPEASQHKSSVRVA